MSVDNFIPQLWSAEVFVANRKQQVYANITNRVYESQLAAGGDRVKINQIGAVSISDYDKNSTTLTYDQLESAAKYLPIDQSKSFSIYIEDIDKAQANVDLMTAASSEAAYGFSDVADQYIAGLYTGAGVFDGLGTTDTPIEINSDNVLEYMGEVSAALTEANCEPDGRYMVIPAWFQLKLRLAKIPLESTTNAALIDGAVTRIMDFDIFVSNNVPTDGDAYKVTAGTLRAITYAEQIADIEALRLIDKIGDGLRGQHVYGALVERPANLAVLSCKAADES